MSAPWWIPATLFFAGASHHVWLLVPAIGCLCASVTTFLRRGLLYGPKALSGIEVREDAAWVLNNNGNWRQVRVAPESRITHRWLWLRFDDGHASHTLLLSDRPGFRNTDSASLRRLTVWLRYSQHGQDDTQRPAFR